MSLSLLLGNIPEIVEKFCQLVDKYRSNFQLEELFKGNRPFPHEIIYRKTLQDNLDMEKIHRPGVDLAFNALELPPNMSAPEHNLKRTQLVIKLLNAYRKENQNIKKHTYKPLLHNIIQKYGLKEVVFTIGKDYDIQKVIDIVLACSCVPPIVSYQKMDNNKYYLDGGFYDSLPVKYHPKEIDMIFALYYKPLARIRNLYTRNDLAEKTFYAYPDKPLPVSTWDYSNPEMIKHIYQTGKYDAQNLLRFLEFHNKFFLN